MLKKYFFIQKMQYKFAILKQNLINMIKTVIKKHSDKKKKELDEILKVNNLSLPIHKYSLYLLPDSTIDANGLNCDQIMRERKTIDLLKSIYDIDYDINVFMDVYFVEYTSVDNYPCVYNDPVNYEELIRLL